MNISKSIFILLSLISFNSFATSADEINHLLSYVESTQCKYERNGTMHTGSEAAEHINKKYEYYRDDIETTEDFIKYSATKSKMSGKYYKIHCADKAVVNSKDWLLSELKRYRLAKK
ncbi:DUF5329 family protein [Thalassotalea crassostreae]|uniref:DUF5329 family protein n=1 Tax=Thalassotalea crassostreae TaxID=1763536 RepID=UPI001D0383E8|nr:DUF5329 family protein [Thalassotalea crassostreae]